MITNVCPLSSKNFLNPNSPETQPSNSPGVKSIAFGVGSIIPSGYCFNPSGGCNFYNDYQSDIIATYLYLPLDGKGSVILTDNTDNNNAVVDRIDYDINAGWPVGGNSRGHSLRLHVSPNSDDNDNPDNWSLSPATENSLWLYEENTEIKNFGSPREENSFRLFDIQYSDSWFPDTSYANGDTLTIYGDVNNIYNADNNYEDNNYGNPIDFDFSWYGTFDIVSDQQYK